MTPSPIIQFGIETEIGIARYAQSLSKPTGPTLLLKLVSVVCAGLGGGFVVASFLIYLIPVVGTAEATLIVGGTLLVLSLVAARIGPAMARLARRPPERGPREASSIW